MVAGRPRVALIHALPQSVAPINDEMARAWPECDRLNLLDDSLSADRARTPATLDPALTERFLRLAEYAVLAGADGILFTCSAFGPCIEAVARRFSDRPVMKPNEAMIAEAERVGGRIGLVATFGPTLASMAPEFPPSLDLRMALAEGALDALQAGDSDRHDRLVVDTARRLATEQDCPTIALAQFSMARLGPAVAAAVGRPVLTPVTSAVTTMRQRLLGGQPSAPDPR